jgi:hypothetical protein
MSAPSGERDARALWERDGVGAKRFAMHWPAVTSGAVVRCTACRRPIRAGERVTQELASTTPLDTVRHITCP